jgi:hypothetical protein
MAAAPDLFPHIHYIILFVPVKQEIDSPISDAKFALVCCSMSNTATQVDEFINVFRNIQTNDMSAKITLDGQIFL